MKWTGSCRFRNIINEMYCCSFSYLLVLLLITVPLLHSRSTVINRCLHVCVLVVALSVSSLAHTTKTTVPSSTWSTRPASHTWVCSHICIWWEPRLIKAAVTTLCVCVFVRRVTGDVPSERQNKLPRLRLKNCRWVWTCNTHMSLVLLALLF